MKSLLILLALLTVSVPAFRAADGEATAAPDVHSVPVPPESGAHPRYVSNRPPLRPSPLVKLPIGRIEPRGWLLSQLHLMREGMTGRLEELSRFLQDDNGWLTGKGRGWEEAPYWLKGFGDLGYILKDPGLEARARSWIEAVLAGQQDDGYFGPPANKTAEGIDVWPNMVMLFVLQSFHEATGDDRVLPFMSRYFRWELDLPEEDLLPGSWQKLRGGDNLESVIWLYNRTGEDFLLELADRIFRRTSDWTSPILTPERDRNWEPSSFYHGVNIAMGFRQPGVYFQRTGNPRLIEAVERNYSLVWGVYGRQPGGMFGADENIRPGFDNPRQGTETCSMVEAMYSNESLLKITGQTRYAERTEDIALNSLPASMTPDLKALHYLTAPNLISCDSSGEHDFENTGTLVSYDPWKYRCCQHNVAFGWPYYAEHLWLATLDSGLALVLFAPCQVRALVGETGTEVRIVEDTDYPFGESVDLTVRADAPVDFPLYLRIPEWCSKPRLSINGRMLAGTVMPGRYAVLKRTWSDGDRVRLELPMSVTIKRWEDAAGSVSVRRGPLWYSLRIAETWNRCGGTDDWPAWEILPAGPWNFGLVVDPAHPEESISVLKTSRPAGQPFEPGSAPVVLRAQARRIPDWKAEARMVGRVPQSPVASDEPLEEVELIPMGCARLRIASFPLIKTPDRKAR